MLSFFSIKLSSERSIIKTHVSNTTSKQQEAVSENVVLVRHCLQPGNFWELKALLNSGEEPQRDSALAIAVFCTRDLMSSVLLLKVSFVSCTIMANHSIDFNVRFGIEDVSFCY